MSASPAAPPSGPSSGTPMSGGPSAPVSRRKPVKASIFNTKKPVRKVAPPGQRPAAPQAQARPPPPRPAPPLQSFQLSNTPPPTPNNDGDFEEYSIVIRKNNITAGQRFHALKLSTRVDQDGRPMIVDPYNETQFVRPLRLHRRYPRDKMEAGDQSEAASGVDDKEREQLAARRAERAAEREETQKLIAPTGGDSSKPNKKKPSKKVEEGRDESNPIRKKRQQLRYEEARPWHLEDFEGKNVWVGSYEQALSESSIMLEITAQRFRMVPIEKWYKFIQTNKVNGMTSEEAEKYLSKKATMSRWGLGTQKANDAARREEAVRKRQAHLTKIREDEGEQLPTFDDGEFNADRDMLDMDFGDEFQDDDEGVLIQGDEGDDAKDIERRIWLEMRGAALGGTGVKDEGIDPEEEERQRQIAEEEEKNKTKRLRKQLIKREMKGEYNSDSDDYLSSDSDVEEDEQKKEEAAKSDQPTGDKSGASTRGTNTPSGRAEKRPNPDASDLSGNESSRKRAKGLNGHAVIKASAAARSLSGDAKMKQPRSTAGSGSGSDTDTSRVGRPKIKLKNSASGSPANATPNRSRAGSPSNAGSRAQSPSKKEFPTLAEIRAAIPADGIEIKTLVALFRAQVGKRTNDFIILVKAAGSQDKQTGKIMQKA